MISQLHATLERQGTGNTVLVLLHGFPIDSRMWDPMVAHLDPRWTVVTVDLPGLGRSHRTLPERPSLATSAQLVHDAVRNLVDGDQKIVIAGLSMGGYVAAAILRDFPDWPTAMVLMDTKGAADTEEQRAKRISIAEIAERDASADVVMGQAKGMLSPLTLEQNPETLHKLESLIASQMGIGVAWSQRAMAERPDTTEVLTQSDLPALVVVGIDDSITPAEGMSSLAGSMNNAQLVQVQEAGHMAPFEQPRAVAQALDSFLTELA